MYILPAALLGGSSIYTTVNADVLRSTYICPNSTSAQTIVPFLQLLAVISDCYVLISLETICRRRPANAAINLNLAPMLLGSTFLVCFRIAGTNFLLTSAKLSAAFLSLGGFISFITHPKHWKWVFDIDRAYVNDLTWDTTLFTISVLCGLEIVSVPLLKKTPLARRNCRTKNFKYMIYGLLHLSIIITFTYIYISSFASDFFHRNDFVHLPPVSGFWSSLALIFGAALYLRISSWGSSVSFKSNQQLLPRIPFTSYIILVLLLVGRALYQFPPSEIISAHPIDILMRDAAVQSQAWFAQASTSKTLAEAVDNYRQRYRKQPPPRFDEWYNYAAEKSSLIMDDYDSIHADLLPFWALSPQSIRLSTGAILSDKWNEVAEIRIRSGKAKIGPNVIPTHRWMLDGILSMMKGFVQWLPDMDLAFNINDEPRVAVPWETLQRLEKIGARAGDPVKTGSREWSSDRAASWHSQKDREISQRPFRDRASMNSFVAYGSIACPPASPARKVHPWDPRALCFSCAAPHSMGLFLSNWTLSASPCHQPDLAHLHGLYLSPAAFKTSHTLLPVFSQSKARGYADILYPSPWNYVDKVKYEPSDAQPDLAFAAKENTLFWRGATSEGLTKHATWKGMARQRLVHLTNNATHPIPMLLPRPNSPAPSYTYTILPPSPLPPLNLTLDLAFVDPITRCWDSDCDNQATEFGLARKKSDFQSHWRHRYLIDVDGAGFSGRFLPFLRSRSLVLKAGVFREWWDARVCAWRHFVPLDVRFHGLFATLAYFAGVGGDRKGYVHRSSGGMGYGGGGSGSGVGIMQGNLGAAEEIAEAGREWAGKVLRKEDMEVYMFRLLLEWGRLTDDRREELGFEG